MSASVQSNTISNAGAFAAWATVYDEQPNPLLSLEERFLSRILPDGAGRNVVDIGCGTGRWLARFSLLRVASLCGIDSSTAMLEIAAGKQLPRTRLIHAELPLLPMETGSADLALASFALSYVEDIDRCASELARVILPDGDLFISDMHPDTAAAMGWERGFSSAGLTYHLAVENRPLVNVVDAFVSKGFSLAACLEPHFGTPERDLLRSCGREASTKEFNRLPPIYLLHFRRSPTRHNRALTLALDRATCALGPREAVSASVAIGDEVVSSLQGGTSAPARPASREGDRLDLRGYLVFPGFVNAHDHLEFALFPRLGSGPYANATEWARDIQANEYETIALHKRVPKTVRLWWGGVRNLLCGVTTVCHHNPLHPSLRSGQFPIRVLQKYGWEHSLAFADDVAAALRRTAANDPFLIHACEGIDQSALEELPILDAMGALGTRTVLVHGLPMNGSGAALLNSRGTALVICPSSNHFLFGKTPSSEQLQSISRLALGSDSPLTAAGDLLDEVRFARHQCHLPAERLYEMVTRQAACILRLHQGEGTVRVGAAADLVAIRRRAGDPAEILATITWRDVELVLVRGRVQLASGEVLGRLPSQASRGLVAFNIEGQLRWIRGPVRRMLQSAENILGKGNVRVGGLRVRSAEI